MKRSRTTGRPLLPTGKWLTGDERFLVGGPTDAEKADLKRPNGAPGDVFTGHIPPVMLRLLRRSGAVAKPAPRRRKGGAA